MNYAFAGCPIVGAVQLNESQLDRVIGRIRTSVKKGWRSLMDTLNQAGQP